MPADDALAEALLEAACELGYPISCHAGGAMPDGRALVAQRRAACEAGDLRQCADYAANLASGWNVAQDGAAALALYEQTCEAGGGHACRALARAYAEGTLAPQDDVQARQSFARACTLLRSPYSCQPYAEYLETGRGGAVDLSGARAALALGCGMADCPALVAFDIRQSDPLSANLLERLRPAIRPEAEKLRRACQAGAASACMAYAQALVGQRDKGLADAVRLVRARACDLGDRLGCVLAGDGAAGLPAYEAACHAGLGEGCVRWALEDRAVESAARLARLQAACDAGLVAPCRRLGEIFRSNPAYWQEHFALTVEPAPAERAMALFARGCDAGDGKACAHLAFDRGQDDPNSAEIAMLQTRACDLGYGGGCAALVPYGSISDLPGAEVERLRALAQRACLLGSDCGPLDRITLRLGRAALTAKHGALNAALLDRYDDFETWRHGPVRRLRAGCRSGAMADCLRLGDYFNGQFDVTGLVQDLRDAEAANALYLHACTEGHAPGCAAYACERLGRLEVADDAERIENEARACAGGYGWGCYALGYYDFKRDRALARALF